MESLKKYISLFPNEKHFVSDGIINPIKFKKSKEKILWILKEPWSDENPEEIKIFDYISYINNFDFEENPQYNTSTQMWRRITYANAAIISNGCLFNDLDDLPDSKEVFDCLFDCALINLKKIPGYTRSNYSNIDKYFRQSQEFIFDQIEEINPTVIICGGTFSHLYPFINKELSNVGNDKTDNYFNWKKRLIINAYHPSYACSYDYYCNYIANIYNLWNAENK
jgi:hypothetical protein